MQITQQAMINALKAIRLTGKIPTLETKCNARMKTNEKLAVLLLLPFFGCKDPSHLPHSAATEWFSVGYNMLYRLLRDTKVDWRRVLSLVSRRVAAYIGTHCQGADGRVRCLAADDTDIAKSGMKVEVFDPNGRMVASFLDCSEIDIHQLPTGTYTLRITLDNGIAIKRVVKQ